MKKKLYIFIFSIIAIVFIFVMMFYTFALFETNANISVSSDLAKWNIKVNDAMVTGSTSNNEFNIGSIDWQSGGHVKEGKAAPGSVGTFNIEIDPSDTQVSFYYTIEIDTSELNNDEFKIQEVKEINGNYFIRTGENVYTGIAYLEDNKNGEKYNISVSLIWNNNEDNNDKDYELGVKADMDITIPVRIDINQYIGTERFIPYEEQG